MSTGFTSAPGLTVSTSSHGGLARSLTGISPTSPSVPTASAMAMVNGALSGIQPMALTRNQYAVECGGVLLDPATNEVCLLFYPDTSEWRLPMSKPDAMLSEHSAGDYSVAGCEPPAHAAQRQITQVTGFRCSHLHPDINGQEHACAYIGPQMVEPLAMQLQMRTTKAQNGSPRLSSSDHPAFEASHLLSGSLGTEKNADTQPLQLFPDPDEADYRQPTTAQLVMSYYYMAWLTQNRFESKAATHPVGLASLGKSSPQAEVTWFKMDTAAQVLTDSSDKVALREAIHRLSRPGAPQLPFAFSPTLVPKTANAPRPTVQPTTAPSGPAQKDAEITEAIADQQPSSASVASALSDGATKADNASASASRPQLVPARNFDLIRKTATSLSKRGTIFKRPQQQSAEDQDHQASAEQPVIVPKRSSNMPRVFSIFYKLVGSSPSSA
ncbi:hypothetical protein GGF46_003842 [Coemansia sp. RSA 552]|nr:hypothetical protein GGF46_003842 [Coemansia sp. RSA 552]